MTAVSGDHISNLAAATPRGAALHVTLTTQPTHDLKQFYRAQTALCWLALLLHPVSQP